MHVYTLESLLHFWKVRPTYMKENRDLVTENMVYTKLRYQTPNNVFKSSVFTYSSVQ